MIFDHVFDTFLSSWSMLSADECTIIISARRRRSNTGKPIILLFAIDSIAACYTYNCTEIDAAESIRIFADCIDDVNHFPWIDNHRYRSERVCCRCCTFRAPVQRKILITRLPCRKQRIILCNIIDGVTPIVIVVDRRCMPCNAILSGYNPTMCMHKRISADRMKRETIAAIRTDSCNN